MGSAIDRAVARVDRSICPGGDPGRVGYQTLINEVLAEHIRKNVA